MAKGNSEFTFTFFDIAYSLGGQRDVDVIYKSLSQIEQDYLSQKEKEVLSCMLITYANDKMFPSWTYLQQRFDIVSNAPIRNKGDFNSALRELFMNRRNERMRMELSNAITDSTSPMELVQKARDVTDKYGRVEKVSSIMPYTSVREAYEMAKKSAMSGLTSGVPEIDLLTAGFQQGTMAVVAGFTSHGKSTVSNNFGYLNAAMGKKVGVISLEIPELMCKYIYLSRHSATILPVIEYQTIIRNHLSEEEQTYLFDIVEKDFEENVGKNLSIIGQDSIPSFTEAGFQQLYESIEEALGGLDMVIWDHVNQFKYVNFDNGLTGDHCINWLTNLTKSYVTKQGTRPVTIAVTQTNREGYKSASRKGGKYELTALQDFNELEKSATYVIFTYADEGMRVNRESKMQLLKHRLGMVQVEPESIVVNFSYAMVGDKFVDHITSMTPEVLSSATDVFFDSGSMSEKNLSTFEKNIHSFESAGTTEVKTVVKSKNETDSGEFLL